MPGSRRPSLQIEFSTPIISADIPTVQPQHGQRQATKEKERTNRETSQQYIQVPVCIRTRPQRSIYVITRWERENLSREQQSAACRATRFASSLRSSRPVFPVRLNSDCPFCVTHGLVSVDRSLPASLFFVLVPGGHKPPPHATRYPLHLRCFRPSEFEAPKTHGSSSAEPCVAPNALNLSFRGRRLPALFRAGLLPAPAPRRTQVVSGVACPAVLPRPRRTAGAAAEQPLPRSGTRPSYGPGRRASAGRCPVCAGTE